MSIEPSQSAWSRSSDGHPEYELASFPTAHVVQVVGDPVDPDADVIELHPARVVVTDRRIVAVDGDSDWAWHADDLEEVVHGHSGAWTILVVPGIEDFGIVVPVSSRDVFRRAVDSLPGVTVRHQAPPRPSSIDPGLARPESRSSHPSWSEATSASTSAAIDDLERALWMPSVDPHAPTGAPPITNRVPATPPVPPVQEPPRDAPRATTPPMPPTAQTPPAPPAPPTPHATVTTQMPVTAPAGPTASRLAPPTSAVPSGPPSGPPRSMPAGDRPDTVHGGGSRVPASGPPPTTPPRLPSLPRPGGGGEPERQRFSLRGRPAASSMADIVPPDTALAGIDARNISAWFGDHQVLDRVSLDMEAGKVTALIGPSGCGKSTFLRILNRMHEMIPGAQMGGEVLVDGHDIYDPERKLTDARREVGMVFQKPNPFPAMSIYDNVLASFRLTGVKATTELKDEIVESCLAKAGLWNEVKDRLRQPGGGLSGGQQQRLCIARALSIKPRVLLMDEPCSALDPTSTRRIEETIMQIVSEVTIVIVTHNMQQAARVSNHCAFFLAEQGTPGLIVEHGPTDVMFGDPQDPRTSDYVLGRFG